MHYDCLIVGKGPAGLSAAIYVVRSGLSVAVVGRDIGALEKAERIDNYFGFEKTVNGRAVLAQGTAQAKRLGVKILTDEVTAAGWQEDGYVASLANGSELTGTAMILATGTSRKKASVKGIEPFEGAGVSYCATCDAFFYREKTCAVIGNGNYALHEARELLPFADKVYILTNGRDYTARTADEQIEIISEKISSVRGEDGRLTGVVFESDTELDLDGLFVAEGTASAQDLAVKLGIEVVDGVIKVNRHQETNIPGIFACGDCTGTPLQLAVAVGEGAVAGLRAAAYIKGLQGETSASVQWR